MCDRIGVSPAVASLGLALLGLILVPGASVSGQEREPSPTPAEIRERIDSLLPLWKEAVRRKRRADSLRALAEEARRIRLDTVRVDRLRILATAGDAAEARRLFSRGWEPYRPVVGRAADRLDRYWFLYLGSEVDHGWDTRPDTVLKVGLGRWSTPGRLREEVRRAVGTALTRTLPEDFGRWVGKRPVLLELYEDEWAGVYRDLATSVSRVARRCFRTGEACWSALGLEAREVGWEAWYTAEQRRYVVNTRTGTSAIPARRETRQACRKGELDACDRFIRMMGWGPPIPLEAGSRASVVAFALQRGGPGAYARLLEGGGPIRARLGRAAGLPPDSLVRAWRREVRIHRPNVHADLGRSRWSVLAWLVVFTLLATRSTRWRLD